MKSVVDRVFIVVMACGLAACATHDLMAKTGPAGTRFNDNGKVTLHRGEPCTPQIMFDFQPVDSKAVVWLAAAAHESKKLTDAARDHRRVRISGVWKRGRQTGCGYVDVSKVAVETTWWSKLWK